MADPLQAALEAAPLSTMVSARLDDVIDSLLRLQVTLEDPLTEPSVIVHATVRIAEPVERLAATLESIERLAATSRDPFFLMSSLTGSRVKPNWIANFAD